MDRPHGRSAQRAADRWRTRPFLAAALAVGLATGIAVVPGRAATATAATHPGGSGPYSSPGDPTGDPDPTSAPTTVPPPPGETGPPPAPSAPTPAPTSTTGVPAPTSVPPRVTLTPRPTYLSPSPPPMTPTATSGTPSPSVEVRVGSGGVTLQVDEAAIDADGTSAGLTVRLGNSGTVEAHGRVEVELPVGVTVPAVPSGCATADSTRTRCDLGPVPAGRVAELRLPLATAPGPRPSGLLTGAAIGQLDPRGSGSSHRVQLGFRITVVAEEPAVVPVPTSVAAPSALPAGAAAPVDGTASTVWSPTTLIALLLVPVLLALGLVTMSLRRRSAVPDTGPGWLPEAPSWPGGPATTPSGAGGPRKPGGPGGPGETGPTPESGIWFKPERPARRARGDLDYGGPGESPQVGT